MKSETEVNGKRRKFQDRHLLSDEEQEEKETGDITDLDHELKENKEELQKDFR